MVELARIPTEVPLQSLINRFEDSESLEDFEDLLRLDPEQAENCAQELLENKIACGQLEAALDLLKTLKDKDLTVKFLPKLIEQAIASADHSLLESIAQWWPEARLLLARIRRARKIPEQSTELRMLLARLFVEESNMRAVMVLLSMKILDEYALVRTKDQQHRTLIQHAQDTHTVSALMAMGANIFEPDFENKSAYDRAVERAIEQPTPENLSTVETMIRLTSFDSFDKSLSAFANPRLTPEMVEWLTQAGASTEARKNPSSMLGLACERGDLKTAMTLIEHGADPFKPDRDGVAPIQKALNAGHTELAETLNMRATKQRHELEQQTQAKAHTQTETQANARDREKHSTLSLHR